MKKDHTQNWSCVYFMQVQQLGRLALLRIGASRQPETRACQLSSELGLNLVLIHRMRAHAPLGKRIVHAAFAEHAIPGEDDWFLPDDRIKGFVRDCRVNGYGVLRPSIISDVLSKYTRSAASYASEAEAYRAIFDSEYRFLRSCYGRRAEVTA